MPVTVVKLSRNEVAYMIAIIDYDAGNIKSVEKAVKYLGEDCILTRDKSELAKADKLILPGVGAFGDAMGKLEKYGLDEIIKAAVGTGVPLLGICLGLQLLFDESDETKGVKGLGILPGKICKLPEKEGFKIPHMGWNSINIDKASPIFKNVEDESYVYFVHSYYLKAANESDVIATTEYTTHIHAAVGHDNVFACQFHPEKSGDTGLTILDNFCKL